MQCCVILAKFMKMMHECEHRAPFWGATQGSWKAMYRHADMNTHDSYRAYWGRLPIHVAAHFLWILSSNSQILDWLSRFQYLSFVDLGYFTRRCNWFWCWFLAMLEWEVWDANRGAQRSGMHALVLFDFLGLRGQCSSSIVSLVFTL